MSVFDECVEAFRQDQVEKASACLAVTADRLSHEISGGTHESMMATSKQLEAVIRAISIKHPEIHRAIWEINVKPLDMTNPLVAAYVMGELSMAQGALANVAARTATKETMEYLRRPESLEVLNMLARDDLSDEQIAAHHTTDEVKAVNDILDTLYQMGAIQAPLRGKTRINMLAPLGSQILELIAREQKNGAIS